MREVTAQFDTALINTGQGEYIRLEGYCIAQVKVIFLLLKTALSALFPSNIQIPKYLAYVEWFKLFQDFPEPDYLFYKTKCAFYQGNPVASIISLVNISYSVHLFSKD